MILIFFVYILPLIIAITILLFRIEKLEKNKARQEEINYLFKEQFKNFEELNKGVEKLIRNHANLHLDTSHILKKIVEKMSGLKIRPNLKILKKEEESDELI